MVLTSQAVAVGPARTCGRKGGPTNQGDPQPRQATWAAHHDADSTSGCSRMCTRGRGTRTVDMNRPGSPSFCPWDQVESRLLTSWTIAAAGPAGGPGPGAVVDRVHLFREDNGRTQREWLAGRHWRLYRSRPPPVRPAEPAGQLDVFEGDSHGRHGMLSEGGVGCSARAAWEAKQAVAWRCACSPAGRPVGVQVEVRDAVVGGRAQPAVSGADRVAGVLAAPCGGCDSRGRPDGVVPAVRVAGGEDLADGGAFVAGVSEHPQRLELVMVVVGEQQPVAAHRISSVACRVMKSCSVPAGRPVTCQTVSVTRSSLPRLIGSSRLASKGA